MTSSEMRGRYTAVIISVAVAAFVAGALFVEMFDPLGPSSETDCLYELLRRGAIHTGHTAFARTVCADIFPEKKKFEPIDFSDVGTPAEQSPQ